MFPRKGNLNTAKLRHQIVVILVSVPRKKCSWRLEIGLTGARSIVDVVVIVVILEKIVVIVENIVVMVVGIVPVHVPVPVSVPVSVVVSVM